MSEATWREILPALLVLLEHGTERGKRIAHEELNRMARAADERDNWSPDDNTAAPTIGQIIARGRGGE